MAEKKLSTASKIIGGDKFGTYQESTGGGTPLAKGEKLKDHPEAERVMQPRDEDGKFTYNSVNGHELKYGPSRGTTTVPLLRGRNNLILERGTILKDDQKQTYLSTVDIPKDELMERCKYFVGAGTEGGHFAGLGEGAVAKKTTFSPKAAYESEEGITGVKGKMTPGGASEKAIDKAKEGYKEDEKEAAWVKAALADYSASTYTPPTPPTKPITSPATPAKEEDDAIKAGEDEADDIKKASDMFGLDLAEPEEEKKPEEEEKKEPEEDISEVKFDLDEAEKDRAGFYAKNKKVLDKLADEINAAKGMKLDGKKVLHVMLKQDVRSVEDFRNKFAL